MFRQIRRPIALLLLCHYAVGCTTWQTPKPAVAPQATITYDRPTRVQVIMQSGMRYMITDPKVVGDSITGTAHPRRMRTAEVPVALARANVAQLDVLEADTAGHQRARITLADGTTFELRNVEIKGDSLHGVTRARTPERVAVALSDVAVVQVRRGNTGLTVLAATGGVLAVGLAAALIALATWDGPFGNCCQ